MKQLNYSVFIVLIMIGFLSVSAQNDKSLFEKKQIVKLQDTLRYRILLPINYSTDKNYPLVLFLHGAGERGNDNEAQLKHGSDLFLNKKNRKKYPAIVVFPQCEKGKRWGTETFEADNEKLQVKYSDILVNHKQMDLLKHLIDTLSTTYAIDNKRIYVGGLSMGGRGTFELVHQNPNLFAAAFPICGGANPEIAKHLTTPGWWIFHGDSDTVVFPEESIQMHEAFLKQGVNTKLTLYPGIEHNSWENAFAEPELLKWLFSKKLKEN